MGYQHIIVSPKQDYSFNQVASTNVTYYVGARAYDSRACVSGILLVRAVSQALAANSTLAFYVYNTIVTPDDPTNLYKGGTQIATLSIAPGDTGFPRVYSVSWTGSAAGSMITVLMQSQYGVTAGAGSITGLGVEMVLRDGLAA